MSFAPIARAVSRRGAAVAAAAFLAAGLNFAPTSAADAAELVLVEQTGCEWCRRWNEEIGPIYPKTAEGAFAPLRRVDLHDMPDDLKTSRRVNFTPTFLIVEEGHEIARMEGYPGEDFFWPMLANLLAKHAGFEPETAPGS